MFALVFQLAIITVGSAEPETVGAGVAYATRDRVWLEQGREGGLSLGTEVALQRGGRSFATCTIDRLSERSASCAVRGARAGDRAGFVRAIVASKAAPAVSSTIGPARVDLTTEEKEKARGAVAAEPFALIEAPISQAPLRLERFSAEVIVEHGTWFVAGSDRGDFERERVDVVLRNLPLGVLGANAALELTALGWSRRPEGARFRAAEPAQLFIYETAVSVRGPRSSLVASAGRIRPYHAPGLAYLDGLQLGWRAQDRRLELGIIAGLPPDLITLEPTTEQWLIDGYWSIAAGEESFFANEGRAGIAYSRSLELGGELESAIQLRLSRELRGAVAARGVVTRDGVAIASARASVDVEPIEHLEVTAAARTRDDRFDLLSPSIAVAGADHASVAASYTGAQLIHFGAAGGLAYLHEEDHLRGFVGPDLGFPRAFGNAGALSLGYREAIGFIPGRTGWVQAVLRAADRARIFARLAYLEDRAAGDALRELGAYGHVDWSVFEQVNIRATLIGRFALDDLGARFSPIGLVARIALAGEL